MLDELGLDSSRGLSWRVLILDWLGGLGRLGWVGLGPRRQPALFELEKVGKAVPRWAGGGGILGLVKAVGGPRFFLRFSFKMVLNLQFAMFFEVFPAKDIRSLIHRHDFMR